MYPTKEGYTALLRKLGVKYFIDVSFDKGQTAGFAEVPCKISYTYNGEKNSFGNSGYREEGRLQQPRPNPGLKPNAVPKKPFTSI